MNGSLWNRKAIDRPEKLSIKQSLTPSQTLKDRATQLLIKYKSGALVTQSGLLEESNCFDRLDRLQRVAAAFKEQLNNAMDAVIRKQPNN